MGICPNYWEKDQEIVPNDFCLFKRSQCNHPEICDIHVYLKLCIIFAPHCAGS